jgi:hypothetical protein
MCPSTSQVGHSDELLVATILTGTARASESLRLVAAATSEFRGMLYLHATSLYTRFGHAFMVDTGSSTGEISGHSKSINAVAIRHQRPFRAATAADDSTIVFHQGHSESAALLLPF